MAGDWIKIEHTTPDKPEVVKLANVLNIDQDAVVGKLIRVWIWADQNSVNGNDVSVTDSFLDRLTFCNGFSVALRNVGWLTGKNGCLMLPNFDRHNGQTSKSRAVTNRRVAKHRSGCNDDSVTDVTDEALEKPLPEKRREEYINNVKGDIQPLYVAPDAAMPPPPGFVKFLEACLEINPAWQKSALNSGEQGIAMEAYMCCKGRTKPSDMVMLKAYYTASFEKEGKGNKFWRPDGRRKFFEAFADVLANAERWRKETKWRPFKATVKKVEQEPESNEPPASVEDFRKLLE